MITAKKHIKEIVKDYITMFPEEFAQFQEGMALQRNLLLDPTFAKAEGQGSDMRALFEMPVTLSEMLITKLSEEEMEWFKAGGSNRKEGARWFAEEFPVFRTPDAI